MAILEKMSFPNKWRKWISFCIFTVRFSILINGEVFDFFSNSRGIRQGKACLASLFILVMETLDKLVIKAVEVRFVDDFHISNPAWRVC